MRRQGFTVIPELGGHDIGRTIHEGLWVPNYFDRRQKGRLSEGLVITIEPIISAGGGRIVEDADGWTVRTVDGSPVAHAEHTIIITRDQPIILTAA